MSPVTPAAIAAGRYTRRRQFCQSWRFHPSPSMRRDDQRLRRGRPQSSRHRRGPGRAGRADRRRAPARLDATTSACGREGRPSAAAVLARPQARVGEQRHDRRVPLAPPRSSSGERPAPAAGSHTVSSAPDPLHDLGRERLRRLAGRLLRLRDAGGVRRDQPAQTARRRIPAAASASCAAWRRDVRARHLARRSSTASGVISRSP